MIQAMHDDTTVTHNSPGSWKFVLYLIVTSLGCGGLVMAIEVLGSRVIGPFFGSGIFVWTSLITVTLVGLALGYGVGGILSDRYGSATVLYVIIFCAGVAIHLIPFIKRPVFEHTLSLGLRLGSLTASALLFGVPLFLLGCVSPYIIKIAARELHTIGKTVGLFSAVSTVGSFIGTLCTGFILIAHFPVQQIFSFIGWSLMLLGILYFVLFRKKWLCTVALGVPLLFPAPQEVYSKVLDNGTVVHKIYDRDTYYGNIKVLDYHYPDGTVREMLLDSAVQGGIDLANGMSVYGYYYYLQYLPYAINPNGKNCLVMGLGTGIIPMWYEKMGIRTDVIDINPEVFTVAEKYFGFHTSGEKSTDDARYFLNSSRKQYDYILLDVFNGESFPTHILSQETLRLISQGLSRQGVLGINLVGSLQDGNQSMSAIISTLQSVFSTVQIYPTLSISSGTKGVGNIEVIAYNFAPVLVDREALRRLPYHPLAASTRTQIGQLSKFISNQEKMILNDEYNPLDCYEPDVKEEVRRRVLQWTHWDLLL